MDYFRRNIMISPCHAVKLFHACVCALTLISFSFTLVACSEDLEGTQPNIVFILADDLGWSDLPIYGNQFNEAPHITQLAQNGMLFDNAYAAAPVCSPTRLSIFSGQYPVQQGMIDFIPGHWRPYEKLTPPQNKEHFLSLEIETFAERLQDAGYTTGYFGKWHLGEGKYAPQNHGFNKVNVNPGGHAFRDVAKSRDADAFGTDYKKVASLTNRAIKFIRENRDNRFFVFLSHYAVHIPLEARERLVQKYKRKKKVEGYPSNPKYAAMIERLDWSVGKVVSTLKELNLEQNTIVIFYSDNGGLIERYDKRDGIIVTNNAPLRAEKGTIYEGGIREPLIISWPGTIAENSKSHSIVNSIDFYPTFLELAGASLRTNHTLAGQSLLPVLTQKEEWRERALYWHYPVYHHDVPKAAIRMGKYKLIENYQDKTIELYDLEADIGETINIATQHPEITNSLLTALKTWQNENGAQLPTENPDFDPEKRFEWGLHPAIKN